MYEMPNLNWLNGQYWIHSSINISTYVSKCFKGVIGFVIKTPITPKSTMLIINLWKLEYDREYV